MKPYLFVPFLREALEKRFEDDPFIDVYATNSYLVARAGGHRLKVLSGRLQEAPSLAMCSSISLAGGITFFLSTLTS
jgi:hypothetical protein